MVTCDFIYIGECAYVTFNTTITYISLLAIGHITI